MSTHSNTSDHIKAWLRWLHECEYGFSSLALLFVGRMYSGILESLPIFMCLSTLCQIIIVREFRFFILDGTNLLVLCVMGMIFWVKEIITDFFPICKT